jgi:hypothetical protein
MPRLPVSTGRPPSVVTASTTVSAPCAPATCITSATGFATPVDVSPCTMATMSAPLEASACLTACGSQARPHSPSTFETVAPHRVNISTSRWPKYPFTTTSTRAPGAVTLRIPVSIPAVPVPETGSENAPSAAPKIRARRSRTSSRMRTIAGSRWLRTGFAMARMTRAETGLGPGPRRIRSGIMRGSAPFDAEKMPSERSEGTGHARGCQWSGSRSTNPARA